MDFNFILLFIDVIHLQLPDFLGGEGRQALGSDDPIVGRGMAIMKETKGWQKARMAAMRSKDQAKIAELGKKSSYMNKMSMEMMQMNMRPMMITFVPLILIFYLVLPVLFPYTVAISPISLNVIPGEMFQLTCSAAQALDTGHVCFGKENALYLWAWYFLSSIAFSGMIMRFTKTSMDLS